MSQSPVPGPSALETAVDDPLVGRTFGNNTVVARITAGGMAEIYLAKQSNALGQRLVVVKRILTSLGDADQFRTMFYDEAQIASRLSHPNVIRVEDFGEDPTDHSLYMVMEYVEGASLLDLLRRQSKSHEPSDQRWAATVIAQAAEGLHHAHELVTEDGRPAGLVHRDVSPHNIIVTPSGIVKVFDFGIAKSLDRMTQTAAGVIKGKFAYMSPEQAKAGPVDRRSDVFSLAVVLWETLTLKRLFARPNDLETYRALCDGRIPRASELRSDVFPELDEVIAYALSRDANDRFSSARAFGQALSHAISRYGGLASAAEIGEPVRVNFGDALAERRRLASRRMTMPTDPRPTPSGPKNWFGPDNLKSIDDVRRSLPPITNNGADGPRGGYFGAAPRATHSEEQLTRPMMQQAATLLADQRDAPPEMRDGMHAAPRDLPPQYGGQQFASQYGQSGDPQFLNQPGGDWLASDRPRTGSGNRTVTEMTMAARRDARKLKWIVGLSLIVIAGSAAVIAAVLSK